MKKGAWALVFAIILHGLLWQFAETKLLKLGEQASNLILGKPVHQTQHIDEEGIPYQTYADGSQYYNPLFVASRANQLYEKLPDPEAERLFIRLCDWLVYYSQKKDGIIWLPYGFDYPLLGMKVPWYSALAQAEAMTAFAKRWEHSGDPIWLERSKALARSIEPPSDLTINLAVNTLEEDLHPRPPGLWFMEYPGDQAPYVLNGHAGVLLQLHRSHQITSDPKLLTLFERGFRGLTDIIYRFDKEGFSLYSLEGQLAGRVYHQKHIKQLKSLIAIHPHPDLEALLKRWQRTDHLPVIVQLFYNPRPRRIAAFVATFVLIWLLCLGIVSLINRG